jgi:hypothetical protein
MELAALSLVGSLYFLVFATTRNQPISDTVEATARNLFSLALAVALARPLIARLLAWPKWQQAAGHVGLAAAFSLFWLWTLTVLGHFWARNRPFASRSLPFCSVRRRPGSSFKACSHTGCLPRCWRCKPGRRQ